MDLEKSYDVLKLCNKICQEVDGCNNCCLGKSGGCLYYRLRLSKNFDSDYKRLIEALEQYVTGHPQKTYLDDFKERFPNARLDKNGYPKFCLNQYLELFGIEHIECIASCDRCWNQVKE